MELKDNFMLGGILKKDAEPILSREKELGCLLTVESGGKTHSVAIFSFLKHILYKKALKGTRVLIPVWKSRHGSLEANVAYPI